jgi:predicted transposase/invertase (TIGR01784 family)
MKVNNKHKSSVFTLLFNDPDTLRELYCALKDVTLPDNVSVIINTLEDVLYMDRINDISFEIGGKLVVLIEHESTINPNMALRLLMYIARIYEKIIGDKNIYSTTKISIPQPEFFVLYNGTAPYPNENVLKLSDLFMSVESLELPEKVNPVLELEVKVLNINDGKNEAIAKKCKVLSQYIAFIAKVRELEKDGYNRENAINKAVKHCRDHDILKEFLEKHASEVLNMLTTEWNWNTAKEVWYEEGREESQKEIALKMKTVGKPVNEIIEFTGLSIEAIEKL